MSQRRSNAPAHRIFDRESSRAVDQSAIERFSIPGIVLMENAARGLASAAREMIDAARRLDPRMPGRVLIACGRGNNGGDGYALARHLHNQGLEPVIVSLGEPQADSDAFINFSVCIRMEIPIVHPGEASSIGSVALIVDALFGTGLDRALDGEVADLVAWMNEAGPDILAVDVPSGLDCDTGCPLGACVEATRTATFLGWKKGFLAPNARSWTGDITVVDIGVPRELLREFGSRANPQA